MQSQTAYYIDFAYISDDKTHCTECPTGLVNIFLLNFTFGAHHEWRNEYTLALGETSKFEEEEIKRASRGKRLLSILYE